LYEDNEYALYNVTLFSRVADNFRTSAREKGFQVSIFSQVANTVFSFRRLVKFIFFLDLHPVTCLWTTSDS